MQRFLKLSLFL